MRKFRKMRGVIACGHPLTAKAGARMLKLGGNAVDAAVAASFASCVCEATLTGLWGGGFALIHNHKNRKNLLFDFFVNMPGLGRRLKKGELDFKGIIADFRGALQEFHIGKGAVGVPGNILGLCRMHEMLGRLPLQEVLAPAILYAKKGFPVTANQAYISQILKPVLIDTKAVRKAFAPKGPLLKTGQKFHAPELASTLEILGKEGPEIFYQGDIGQKTVKFFKAGGLITQKDLDHYRVIIRKPLQVTYRGETILMNPSPSSGGSLIAYSLGLLQKRRWDSASFNSGKFLKTLIGVMRDTNIMRCQKEKQNRNLLGSTTHISVMDEEGNAVSMTTSHGSGAGIGIKGLGFPFNNMLGEEDLNPLGFHKMKPGIRFQSMMCPTIALKKGRPHLVLGSGGSNRLRTAILQALIKLIDFKMTIKQAAQDPRIHWERDALSVEPGLHKSTIRSLLKLDPKTIFWREKNLYFGGVHAVLRREKGDFPWDGAGDPRRGGVVERVK